MQPKPLYKSQRDGGPAGALQADECPHRGDEYRPRPAETAGLERDLATKRPAVNQRLLPAPQCGAQQICS